MKQKLFDEWKIIFDEFLSNRVNYYLDDSLRKFNFQLNKDFHPLDVFLITLIELILRSTEEFDLEEWKKNISQLIDKTDKFIRTDGDPCLDIFKENSLKSGDKIH